MTTVIVELSGREYPIHIGKQLLPRAAHLVPSATTYASAAVLTHPRLAQAYAGPVCESLRERGIRAEIITIPAGERYKNLRSVERLYDRLLDLGLDRRGLLVTVGGGVLGDLGGFAAATYLRGIDFIQVPTTLLAQVDASVGGKTGVDLSRGKNLVGAFHQPRAVLIDIETLQTLSARELRSGLAEVIKYGIIADKAFFARLSEQMPLLLSRDPKVLESSIHRSCRIKAEVVAGDETEQGPRAILNFGHTVGHALETATGYRRYKHGEAISIGMVSAALIGESLGVTDPEATAEIVAILRAARLPTAFPRDVPFDAILQNMARDKKAASGRARFVLVRRIGNVEHGKDVPETAVRLALARQVEMS